MMCSATLDTSEATNVTSVKSLLGKLTQTLKYKTTQHQWRFSVFTLDSVIKLDYSFCIGALSSQNREETQRRRDRDTTSGIVCPSVHEASEDI